MAWIIAGLQDFFVGVRFALAFPKRNKNVETKTVGYAEGVYVRDFY